MHVVIFSGGEVEKGKAVEKSLQQAGVIFAADSGAETALSFGILPSQVFGDFDSLSQKVKNQLLKKKVKMHTFSESKDETDTELAVIAAKENGATRIDILGGVTGNRLDHVLANVLLTFSAGSPSRFINGNQISWVEKGPITVVIEGEKGDLLSLLPLSDTSGIDTHNLHYALSQGKLAFGQSRGVSNVLTNSQASVSFTTGIMLFIHTLLTE
jgi:thiamine pyrophosphokinase